MDKHTFKEESETKSSFLNKKRILVFVCVMFLIIGFFVFWNLNFAKNLSHSNGVVDDGGKLATNTIATTIGIKGEMGKSLKLYENKEIGFRLEYPHDWYYSTHNNYIDFYSHDWIINRHGINFSVIKQSITNSACEKGIEREIKLSDKVSGCASNNGRRDQYGDGFGVRFPYNGSEFIYSFLFQGKDRTGIQQDEWEFINWLMSKAGITDAATTTTNEVYEIKNTQFKTVDGVVKCADNDFDCLLSQVSQCTKTQMIVKLDGVAKEYKINGGTKSECSFSTININTNPNKSNFLSPDFTCKGPSKEIKEYILGNGIYSGILDFYNITDYAYPDNVLFPKNCAVIVK